MTKALYGAATEENLYVYYEASFCKFNLPFHLNVNAHIRFLCMQSHCCCFVPNVAGELY